MPNSANVNGDTKVIAHNLEAHEIIKCGQAALDRIAHNHWADWVPIARALDVLRSQSLAEAERNDSFGPRYRAAMGSRLRIHGFDRLDKSTRSRLLEIADNIEAIEAWRASLPDAKRLALNHPQRVLAAFKRAMKPASESNTTVSASDALGTEHWRHVDYDDRDHQAGI